MKRLAIITTHPIQYNAPLFRLLSDRGILALKVFYTWGQSAQGVFDPVFQHRRQWDIPLLEGYEYEFIQNVSKHPGSNRFLGIQNPSLIPKIKEYCPDAILVFGWAFLSHLRVLMYFHGRIPVWFRGDSTLLNDPKGFSLRKFIRYCWLRYVYSNIDSAFYVGDANKAYFKKMGLKEDQLVRAPHAIDNNRFAETDARNGSYCEDMKEKFGINSDAFVFLYAGKLEPVKNLELLINTFKRIGSLDCILLIVGNGPLEKDLRLLAKNDSRIKFIGFQNQLTMPNIYRLANVFVLPSYSETWGLSMNEAMACSIPVIASDLCGGAADLINTNTGWVFQSDNQDSLFKIMEYCIIQTETLKIMGNEAKKHVENFNFNNISVTIENKMERLINN